MAKFTHAFPELAVADLDHALAFYTGRLGLAVDWRAGDHMAVVGNGVISLFLRARANGALGPSSVILNVDDADAVYAAWTAAEVTILDPIATRSWGMREFTAQDLDGNQLRVGHVDESQADYSGVTDA